MLGASSDDYAPRHQSGFDANRDQASSGAFLPRFLLDLGGASLERDKDSTPIHEGGGLLRGCLTEKIADKDRRTLSDEEICL